MKAGSTGPLNLQLKILMRVLRSVTLLLTGSAVLVMFVAIPAGWLDKWHLLPGWSGFVVVVALFPIIAAWGYAGFYFLLIVSCCELALVLLRPSARKARIEAIGAVCVCAITCLYFYLSVRFNFN